MNAKKPNMSLLVLLAAVALTGHAAAVDSRQMLADFVTAWRGSEAVPLSPGDELLIAFDITGERAFAGHVVLGPAPGGRLERGLPESPDLLFRMDAELLERIHAGEISALTAMGQARADDPIPLEPEFGDSFQHRSDAGALFRRLALHFFNRHWPPRIPFGEAASRLVHGGNAAIFAYDEGFRSAWYQLRPGMHMNADPVDQVNDFPQLLIITRGSFQARFDGVERRLNQGEAILVPAGMRHEFRADEGDYGEMIWIAWGPGA